MGQVTLYLDSQTERRMAQAVKRAGVPKSRWVADLIREKTRQEWPDEVTRLAGAWPDMPDVKEMRAGGGKDAPRNSPK